MLFGERERFAIEVTPVRVVDQWVYGRFLFWIRGTLVGDPADESVHLRGCIGWLQDFVSRPRNRYEPGLFEADKDFAFQFATRVEDQPLGFESKEEEEKEEGETRFSRFDLSYLGMSSFDRVTLLLFEAEDGRQRLVWQQGDAGIEDATLPARRLQSVASACVQWFADEVRM